MCPRTLRGGQWKGKIYIFQIVYIFWVCYIVFFFYMTHVEFYMNRFEKFYMKFYMKYFHVEFHVE